MISRVLLLSLCLFFLPNKGNTQIITTIAGTKGVAGYSGDGGQAITALLAKPTGISTDNNGSIYIGDWFNWVIRKINPAGIITTFSGTGTAGYSGDGGPAVNARIHVPYDIDVDNTGNVYFVDLGNEVIRKINTQGVISTVAGDGTININGPPFIGDGGPAILAPLYDPKAVAVDNNGNFYIAETAKNSIRKVNSTGIISTVAGQGLFSGGYTGDGGHASQAKLYGPIDIAIDNNGNIIIADLGNHAIRKINTAGIISTIAGNGTPGYSGDGGLATAATLNRPFGLAVDNANNIYIAEEANHVIRKISNTGIISTIAGTGIIGYSGDGGPAINARLSFPQRISIDNAGNIYLTDNENQTVRKISGCNNTIVSSVTIVGLPVSVCKGDTITFSANPINGGTSPSFNWKVNGNDAGANNSIFKTSFLKEGDIVTCIMISSISCTLPVTSTNSIQVSIKPGPAITLPADITILPGSTVQLNAVVTGTIMQYLWTPGAGLSNASIANPVAAPVNTTTYQLKVVANNGCIDSAKIKVIVYKKIYIPSAFTPNGDGKNDIFRIPEGTTFDLWEFSVYNRWGEVVFKTKDISKGWNGNYKDQAPLPGVYIYLIKGKDQNNEVLLKGTITLIK
jgi:gliding motility-associated-like protein